MVESRRRHTTVALGFALAVFVASFATSAHGTAASRLLYAAGLGLLGFLTVFSLGRFTSG